MKAIIIYAELTRGNRKYPPVPVVMMGKDRKKYKTTINKGLYASVFPDMKTAEEARDYLMKNSRSFFANDFKEFTIKEVEV